MALLDEILLEQDFPVVIGAFELKIAPMTLTQAARLGKWVADNFPSPMENCRPDIEKIKDMLDREKAYDVVLSFYEGWPPAYGSGEASARLYHSTAGRAEVIREAIRKNHPEIAENDAACWKLACHASSDEFAAILLAFHGRKNGPKAGGPVNPAHTRDQIGAMLLAGYLSRVLDPKKSAD